jgi:hypothetical protein
MLLEDITELAGFYTGKTGRDFLRLADTLLPFKRLQMFCGLSS